MENNVKSILYTGVNYKLKESLTNKGLAKAALKLRSKRDGYDTINSWLNYMLEFDEDLLLSMDAEMVADNLLFGGDMFFITAGRKQVSRDVEQAIYNEVVELINQSTRN